MNTSHRVIIGDSRYMLEVPDETVHLIITSPPYWQLKDYGDKNQIGYNDSYEEYINNLNLVWAECFRVLYDGCRLCINVGDQFARSTYYGRYKVIPIRTEIIKFCEAIGLDYIGAIIWQKVTTCNTSGGASIMGSYPYPRNGMLKIDYEFILIFKKPGNPPAVSKDIKELSKLTKEEWNLYFYGHWNFPGQRQGKHLAMFPEELPRRLIKMFSFVGDTVLDPFLGSGTTSLVAKNLNRHSLGYEINKDFIPIIESKLAENPLLERNYNIIMQDKFNINFQDRISKLPYIFRDTVRIDKNIDPKILTYGSKIDSNSKREVLYTVIDIISPELLVLNDNVNIRLIGIREKQDKKEAAIKYLTDTVRGKKVFVKFDENKYDEKNNLLCYLYLKNRTFINAHLIKNALVDVEVSINYKHKARFLTYINLKKDSTYG
ncbi:MAG: hypothetical protein L3V56_11345 [Candidatus Magnetoovum sp. WYHC-5]|nr:hypothetical protein [Candidatus Magnetoovum sp. WYHC-5]